MLSKMLIIRAYSMLLRLLPLAGGTTRLSFNPIINRLFARMPTQAYARMLNGLRILVTLRDYHGRILFLFGTNDPKVHHVVQALLRKSDVFLDIGANYGSIGLLAAECVGPLGRIHLFEPQPNLCEAVQEAINERKLSNVTLHNVALMDCDDQMQMARPLHHSGMATLVKHCDQQAWDTLTVQVKNVATYLPPLIKRESFGVKIDVEGAEPFLMSWLIKEPNLRFIVFEAAHNQQLLYNMVRESDLELYGPKRTVFSKTVERVDVFEQMLTYHDLVAVRFPYKDIAPKRLGSYALGHMVRGAKRISS